MLRITQVTFAVQISHTSKSPYPCAIARCDYATGLTIMSGGMCQNRCMEHR